MLVYLPGRIWAWPVIIKSGKGESITSKYEVSCKVNLIQGDPITFKVPAGEDMRRNAASRLEQAMKSSYVGVKLPDRLVLVPTHNIQSIEITPPPPGRMVYVVNDAIPIDDE